MELKNKTAIVTGAGSGIGREVALALSAAGCRVLCAGRRMEPLQETTARMGPGTGLALPVDVTDINDVERMATVAAKELGRPGILINNAGRYHGFAPLWEADAEDMWQDITVNLKGTLLATRAVLPRMMDAREGVIVNFSGGGAHFPLPASYGYGCSKAGVVRFTDILAHDLRAAGSGVITFAYDPGFNITPMTEELHSRPGVETWLPHVKKMIDTNTPSFTPAEAARQLVALIGVAEPVFSGRLFFSRDEAVEVARLLKDGADPEYRMLRLTGRHE